MTSRIFLVGTDTGCGKTSVAAALLRCARGHGLRAIPFKPAASGGDDPEVLAHAAALLPAMLARICPHRYAAPLAPGVADDPRRFAGPSIPPADPAPLEEACAALDDLEAELRPDLTIIEGAGGWWTPMPGGTWQPTWVKALRGLPVIVGRTALGTINHTLLTLDGVRAAGHRPPGFFLSRTTAAADPSEAQNPGVIAAACDLPCLGILPFGHNGRGWLSGQIFEHLRVRAAARAPTPAGASR